MPAVKSASPIGSIVKQLSSSFNKHKADETTLGAGGSLPGTIKGGIAKFVGGKLDVYKSGPNKDKPYMSLVGVVISPSEYKGMQTRCRIDLFQVGQGDKVKSQDEQVARALNELRKLGIDTAALAPDDWQDAMESKGKEDVAFRFHTSQTKPTTKYPEPRVYEWWDGLIESYEANGEAVASSVVEEEPEAESNGEATDTSDVDWAAVGEAAEAGDAEARAQITQAGIDAGIAEQVEAADNWIEAAGLLGGEVAEQEAEANTAPEKGETVNYKPPKAKKSIECEVTAVFEGKETCNLKAEDGTSYKGIKWSELER